MCIGLYIRIHPESHVHLLVHVLGYGVYHNEFRKRLHVKKEYPLAYGLGDLFFGLTHACIYDPLRRAPNLKSLEKLASRYYIKTRSRIHKSLTYRKVGVGLHRKTDQGIHFLERLLDLGKMIHHRVLTIQVKRCRIFLYYIR